MRARRQTCSSAIADRYVDRPACPTKDWPERTRIPHVLALAKDCDVQGAIVIQQKFCDPHELDIPAIEEGAGGGRDPDPLPRVRRHRADGAVQDPRRGVPGDDLGQEDMFDDDLF